MVNTLPVVISDDSIELTVDLMKDAISDEIRLFVQSFEQDFRTDFLQGIINGINDELSDNGYKNIEEAIKNISNIQEKTVNDEKSETLEDIRDVLKKILKIESTSNDTDEQGRKKGKSTLEMAPLGTKSDPIYTYMNNLEDYSNFLDKSKNSKSSEKKSDENDSKTSNILTTATGFLFGEMGKKALSRVVASSAGKAVSSLLTRFAPIFAAGALALGASAIAIEAAMAKRDEEINEMAEKAGVNAAVNEGKITSEQGEEIHDQADTVLRDEQVQIRSEDVWGNLRGGMSASGYQKNNQVKEDLIRAMEIVIPQAASGEEINLVKAYENLDNKNITILDSINTPGLNPVTENTSIKDVSNTTENVITEGLGTDVSNNYMEHVMRTFKNNQQNAENNQMYQNLSNVMTNAVNNMSINNISINNNTSQQLIPINMSDNL